MIVLFSILFLIFLFPNSDEHGKIIGAVMDMNYRIRCRADYIVI